MALRLVWSVHVRGNRLSADGPALAIQRDQILIVDGPNQSLLKGSWKAQWRHCLATS